MNIKISDLYTKCEDMAKAVGLSVNDRFVFDLQDDTSVESIKSTFKGIEELLTPGVGRYMVLMVSNEKPDVLMAVFPETEEGEVKFTLFNVNDQSSMVVTDEIKDDETVSEDGEDSAEVPVTLDNVVDELKDDEVEAAVNDFVFADDEEKKDGEEEKPEDEEPKADDEEKPEDEPKGDEEPKDEEKPEEEEPEDEPKDEEPAGDEEDDEFEVVDDEEDKEPVDEEEAGPGVAKLGDGDPAEVGDGADKEVVVSEDETPAEVGDGADQDKDAKAVGVTGQGDGEAADVGKDADADKDAKAPGVTGQGDGTAADVGTDADKEVVVGEGEKNPAEMGDGKPATAEDKNTEIKKLSESKKVVKEGVPPPAPAAADPAAAPAPAAPAITDPEKNIRDLIKYYTDELARVTADDTVSTEVVSGIQEIIASLVKNLESISDLEDTETEEAKAAAKAAKADKPKDDEVDEVSEDGVPPSIEGDGAAPAEDAKAAEVGGDAGVPVDQNVTLSSPNMTPDANVEMAAATSEPLIASPADATADVAGVELDPEPAEPAADTTVDIPDVSGATIITTDAPVDVTTGEPADIPAKDDFGGEPEPELPSDQAMIGPDGLPSDDLPAPSDKFIDDQVASLQDGDLPEDQGLGAPAADDVVNFVKGDNAINWSDNLYDGGKANAEDNDKTVPQALKELKEYAERMNETVSECGGEAVNEVTIGRINKFCNLCATAYDTWHKIQDAMNASNELCEAMSPYQTLTDKMDEETDDAITAAQKFEECDTPQLLKESAEDFLQVQNYIKSIKHLL